MEPVTYTVIFEVQPGRTAAFLERLNAVLDAMRHESTFIEAVLHRDPDRDDRFLLYETWASHEDVVDVQLSRDYRRQWHEELPHLLASDRDIAIWQPLRSDRATG